MIYNTFVISLYTCIMSSLRMLASVPQPAQWLLLKSSHSIILLRPLAWIPIASPLPFIPIVFLLSRTLFSFPADPATLWWAPRPWYRHVAIPFSSSISTPSSTIFVSIRVYGTTVGLGMWTTLLPIFSLVVASVPSLFRFVLESFFRLLFVLILAFLVLAALPFVAIIVLVKLMVILMLLSGVIVIIRIILGIAVVVIIMYGIVLALHTEWTEYWQLYHRLNFNDDQRAQDQGRNSSMTKLNSIVA